MAEVLPRHYIIGIIMFVFFVMGTIGLINGFDNAEETFMDADDQEDYLTFNDTFNKLGNINDSVNSIKDSIITTDPDPGIFGFLNSLIGSAWNTLHLLFNSLSFMNSVFGGLSDVFGIPEWVSTLMILLVIVVIAFAIYSALFQTQV